MLNKEIREGQPNETIRFLKLDEVGIAVNIENEAFRKPGGPYSGNGEDIYTLAMIQKMGWLLGYPKNPHEPLHGVLELVPSKDNETVFIHGVAVNPNKKYNGAGVELIADAIQIGKREHKSKIAATIAPTNGASLNAFINKHGFKATHFYPDFYGEGEHRFWVEKDITESQLPFDETNWRELYATQEYPNQHVLIEDTDYESLERLINGENYHMAGIIRPDKSGHHQNLLYLVQQPPQEVTPLHE